MSIAPSTEISFQKLEATNDETGNPKKGTKTDYVSRQDIGQLGKVENGLVAVAAYALIDGITFPLIFECSASCQVWYCQ